MNIVLKKGLLLLLGIASFFFCLFAASSHAEPIKPMRSWSIQGDRLGAQFTSGESIRVDAGAKSIYSVDAVWTFDLGGKRYALTGDRLADFLKQVKQ